MYKGNNTKELTALAKELGSLTTQVSEGADAWLRQGKSIEEVNKNE